MPFVTHDDDGFARCTMGWAMKLQMLTRTLDKQNAVETTFRGSQSTATTGPCFWDCARTAGDLRTDGIGSRVPWSWRVGSLQMRLPCLLGNLSSEKIPGPVVLE